MISGFYVAAAIAVLSTAMAITRTNAVHGLLYLIVSLLSVAVMFFILGAPFVAALEVIIYAGAIVVLFLFVVMMLNVGNIATAQERRWLGEQVWRGPVLLCAALFIEVAYSLWRQPAAVMGQPVVDPEQVGLALYGPYAAGVLLVSLLLLAGLVGAYHLGKREK